MNPQADANDVRYLRTQLIRLAVSDFQRGELVRVYFERLGITELEFKRTAIFKGPSGKLLEVEVPERHGIGRAAAELGGGLVRLWLHAEAPEPWTLQIASHLPDRSGPLDPPASDPKGENADQGKLDRPS